MPMIDKGPGTGCRDFAGVYSTDHNKKPSTERGKRRHENRGPSEKNRAEKAWSGKVKR